MTAFDYKMLKIKNIAQIYKQLFTTVWQFWHTPEQAWHEATTTTIGTRHFYHHYVLPSIGLCVLAAFTGCMIRGANGITAAVSAFINGGMLMAALWLAKLVCRTCLKRSYNITPTAEECNKIVGYPFSIMFALNISHSLFPTWFFVIILAFYVVYELWFAAEVFFQLEENNRGRFLLFNSLAIIFLPILLDRVSTWLLPNIMH